MIPQGFKKNIVVSEAAFNEMQIDQAFSFEKAKVSSFFRTKKTAVNENRRYSVRSNEVALSILFSE